MFACVYLPPPADRPALKGGHPAEDPVCAALVQVARDFSPRVETPADRTVIIDIGGLGRLIGNPRTIGEELRRAAADVGLRVHIAVAPASTAAVLLARARAGLTVVTADEQAGALASLPIAILDQVSATPDAPAAPVLARWGLRTLGEFAALPSADVAARLGKVGLEWQRWAKGDDTRPLVPAVATEPFEASLDLEWPVDALEPLSFALARLFDGLCERLEREDRGAVVLHVGLDLVTPSAARSAAAAPRRSLGGGGRQRHERTIELPAPMRDARVLRTLAMLDLESNPPPQAVDRVSVSVEVTEGRVLQFGLFARALATDTLATLMARLGALNGSDRVGAPSLVDTYRPGAFAMATFDPSAKTTTNSESRIPNPDSRVSFPRAPSSILRRLRSPIPARVTVADGRPVHVTTDRRGFTGGRVNRCEGPWRSSGDWWKRPWNCDEWDVTLTDGAVYRISQSLDERTWFLEGLID